MELYSLQVVICLAVLSFGLASFDDSHCGKRARKFERSFGNNRIVGGVKAVPGSWPWMASTYLKSVEMRFCGAAIIHPQWMLSAAHCFKFKEFPDTNWIMEVGKYEENRVENFTSYYDVVKVIIHPRFDDSEGAFNDLVLVKINETLDWPDHYSVNSLCLADYDLLDSDNLTNCYAIGWGANKADEFSSNYLSQVKLPLRDPSKCFEKFQFKFDPNTQVCAGGMSNGGFGTCFGDSGGPLQCQFNKTWYLVGITSYGKACALPNTPDVFTKVAAYLDWIQDTIAKNS